MGRSARARNRVAIRHGYDQPFSAPSHPMLLPDPKPPSFRIPVGWRR